MVSSIKERNIVTCILLSLITCGIYGYFWIWKMEKANATAKAMRGMSAKDNSVLYLVLQFLGLGIVNYCLIQSDLNKYAVMPMQQVQYQNPNMNQYQDYNQNNNQNMGV